MLQFSDYTISEKTLRESISKGGEYYKEVSSKLVERRFSIGDFGIERSILFHWLKKELMPYENKSTGWQKFSFVEFVWLKIIVNLRDLGLNLEKIKEIKEQLFNVDLKTLKSLIIEQLISYNGEFKNKEEVIKVLKNKDVTDTIWLDAINEAQISYFFILLIHILTLNENLCIVIDDENKCHFVTFGVTKKTKEANDSYLIELTNKSFVLINVRKIINGFFTDDEITYDNDYVIGFLNEKERVIIDKIWEGNVKEILITFSDNKPERIILTKSINTDDVINKTSRLLKKDGCRDVTIKQRDGKTLYYETKEIIKL